MTVVFFDPSVATVIFFVFLCLAHDDDFLAKSTLTLRNEGCKSASHPRHLEIESLNVLPQYNQRRKAVPGRPLRLLQAQQVLVRRS